MAKLGIIADIHGKDKILQIVLSELRDCSIIANLGDVVSYDGDVNSVLNQLDMPHIINIKGNHDLEVLAKTNSSISLIDAKGKILPNDYGITQTGKKFISAWPIIKLLEIDGKKCGFIHGYSWDLNPNYFEDVSEDNAKALLDQLDCDYAFVGHSGMARLFSLDRCGRCSKMPIYGPKTIKLPAGQKYVINVAKLATKVGPKIDLAYTLFDGRNNELQFITKEFKDARQ